ncbi:MAG TPA: cupin domain-containing protein [Allosphingosinicella sp.]
MQLADFDTGRFLRDYWQKKPLLIRSAWRSWNNPLEPDALAGLACEEEVESRLVTRTGDTWEVEHGPFAEDRFGRLGKQGWTLLVQAVDQYVPEVAALLDPFRFVPNWRIDDVMVSFAADGGGVGPHFDQYDVFLVQGLGRRRWRIGGHCDPESELLPNEDLRLLAGFEASEEWILEPGDILYVPPGIAHEGVAVGEDCMTYSIGFRAPSRGDLIAHWSEHLLGEMRNEDRYADPDLRAEQNPGEISDDAIDRLHAMVAETILDRDSFARWFGRYSSTPKYPDLDWRPETPITAGQMRERLACEPDLRRNPASRFSFIRQPAGSLILFADGECFECGPEAAALAERLCAQDRIAIDPGLAESGPAVALIVKLFNQGSIVLGRDDEA